MPVTKSHSGKVAATHPRLHFKLLAGVLARAHPTSHDVFLDLMLGRNS
jgi:hypothetical protein